MPDIKIVKLKLRRGSDAQRKLVTLDQGEMGYVTDSKRVFVGDGTTAGGIVVGSRFFTPIPTNKTDLAAYVGDVVVENSLMFQLTGADATDATNWVQISPKPDNLTITANGSNQLAVNAATMAGSAISIEDNKFNVAVDDSTISIVSNQLVVSAASMAGSAINIEDNKFNIAVDNSTVGIVSNQITLSSLGNATLAALSSNDSVFQGYFAGTPLASTLYQVVTATEAGGSPGTTVHTLSSAGFAIINFGSSLGQMAIPVFRIPTELQDSTFVP